ncbi:MAG: hypothetical protein H7145_19980 [Akkermansiaceae bacterium]|nr:hypothetical protein [Armatimonadota bacterium]
MNPFDADVPWIDRRPGKRLRIEFTESAEAQMSEGFRWLSSLSMIDADEAEKWADEIAGAVEEEAELQGTLPFDRPIDPNSPIDRPAYRVLRKKGKRRSAGWYISFELLDADDDGIVDTLRVLGVKHSSQEGSR